MLEMIPRASGLKIECGLFLWLTGDVGKLLQVIDVICIVCVELDLIHGGGGHGLSKNSMGWPRGLGKMTLGFGDVITMSRRVSNCRSLHQNGLGE